MLDSSLRAWDLDSIRTSARLAPTKSEEKPSKIRLPTKTTNEPRAMSFQHGGRDWSLQLVASMTQILNMLSRDGAVPERQSPKRSFGLDSTNSL